MDLYTFVHFNLSTLITMFRYNCLAYITYFALKFHVVNFFFGLSRGKVVKNCFFQNTLKKIWPHFNCNFLKSSGHVECFLVPFLKCMRNKLSKLVLDFVRCFWKWSEKKHKKYLTFFPVFLPQIRYNFLSQQLCKMLLNTILKKYI